MAEVQVEFTPEDEARIKWQNLLLGKTQAVVDEPAPAVEETIELVAVSGAEVVEDSPEAILAQLFKSMKKA
jgi:hypothetical protein